VVQKFWNHCNILRDGGLSYGEYPEQLKVLLVFKIADGQFYGRFSRIDNWGMIPVKQGLRWMNKSC
jgi:type I restriction enzyme M protein